MQKKRNSKEMRERAFKCDKSFSLKGSLFVLEVVAHVCACVCVCVCERVSEPGNV